MKKIYTSFIFFYLTLLCTTVFATDHYWVGGSGDWKDNNHWSYTSGGAPGATVPGAEDNVYFDSKSFSKRGNVINISGEAICKDFNLLNISDAISIVGEKSSTLIVHGSYQISSSVNNQFKGKLFFTGDSRKLKEINTSGNIIFGDVYFNGNSNWVFSSPIRINGTLKLLAGNLNTNDQPLSLDAFETDGSVNRGLDLGLSKLFVANSWKILSESNFKLNSSSSVVRISKFAKKENIVKGKLNYNLLLSPNTNLCDYSSSGGPIINTSTSSTQSTCKGSNDATATVVATGCTSYEYSWNTPLSSPVTSTGGTSVVSALPPGTYTVTITCNGDPSFQCDDDVIVNEPAAVRVNQINITEPTCFGACNGSATATTGGGTAPRTLTWYNGGVPLVGPPKAVGSSVTNLCSGQTYTLHVQDSRGCFKDSTFTVDNPTQVIPGVTKTNVNCKDACDGTATANPSGGNPGVTGYTFSWNTVPPQNTASISNLCPGSYTVTVTDASGCSNSQTITITEPPALTATVTNKTNATCNGLCDGSAEITAAGGTAPYTYSWSSAAIIGPNPSNLCAGSYNLTVTDALGCIVPLTLIITEPPPLPVSAGNDTTICFGLSGGLLASGAGAGGTYTWSPITDLNNPNIANPVASPTSTTTYTVTGTSSVGCTNTDVAVVNVNPLPTVSAGPDVIICENSSTILVGSGAVTYLWSPGTDLSCTNCVNPTADPTSTTTYTVTGTDINGCRNTDAVEVQVNPAPPVTAGADASVCIGLCTTLNGGGAGASGTYVWTPSTGLNDPNLEDPTACPVVTTTYTVTGTDINGCSETDIVVITVNNLPTITATPATSTICNGGCVDLSATGAGVGGTYVWDPTTALNNGNIATPRACPTAQTTYTVTGTDANGCKNTDDVVINVNQLPIVNANDITICAGVGSALNATGASTYVWTPPTNLSCTNCASPVASPTVTTTYTVTGTDANGCVNTDQAVVNVNQLPTITAGADASVCIGSCTTLNGGGAGASGTYVWTPSTGLNDPNLEDPTACPVVTTTYTVTGTDINGCSQTDIVVITVNNLPTITATPVTSTICNGGCVDLSATGAGVGGTYVWDPATALSNPNIATPRACPTTQTTYTVTGTDANGCRNTDDVVINVNQLPIVNANDITICAGVGSALNATGASTYTWSPTSNLSCSNCPNPVASPTVTTTYTVTGTDANGCVNTDQAVVNVNQLPTITAGADASVCIGSCTTLNGGGAGASGSYVWTPATGLDNPNLEDPLACPVVTTTYTVTGTDINGCKNIDAVVITVNNLPTITASPATSTICNTGCVNISASGAGVGGTYSWNPPTGLSNPNISGPQACPISQTTYTVTGTDANGCQNTDDLVINVNPLPVISASDTTICAGVNTTLNATGALTYVWSPGTNLSCTNCASPVANPTTTITYTVTGTDINNCSNIDQVVVTVNPLPTITLTPTDTTVCGNSPVSISASGATSYAWSPTTNLTPTTGTPVVANPSVTTTYTATGTDNNGCRNTASVVINATPAPSAAVTPKTSNICPGNSIPLTATGGGTYNWSPVTDLSCSNCANPTANPTVTTTYTVTVTNAAGCTDTALAVVNIISAPLITITPANSTICSGGSTTLTAGGGITYNWTPSASLSCTNCANPVANPTSTSTYTVTGTSGPGCVNTATAVVNVNPLPTITTSGNVSICSGGSTILTANGAMTYAWTPTTNLNPSNGLAALVTANPSATTTYTVTGTDANGCRNTSTLIVTVNPLPTVNAGANASFCVGGSTTLNATGANTYSWNPTTGLSNPNISNPVATPASTTTYTVTGTNASGCTDIDAVVVTVNSIVINAGSDVSICFGDSASLTASGGTNYVWSPTNGLSNANISNPKASPLVTTTYTVSATNAGGCSGTDIVVVNINSLNVTATGINPTGCSINDGSISVAVSGGSAPYTYNFNPPNITQASNTINGLADGVYNITVTDVVGCTGSQSVVLSDPSGVTLTSNVTDATTCAGVNGIIDLTVSGGVGPFAYTWTGPVTGTSEDITGPAGIYFVTVTDQGTSCNTSLTDTINEPTPVQVDAGSDVTICTGQSTTLTATAGLASYSWSPVATIVPSNTQSVVATPLTSTVYTVIGTDVNNCVTTDNITVTLNPLPTANAGTDRSVCSGTTIQLSGSGAGVGGSYNWTSNPVGFTSVSTSPSVTVNVTTTYTLTVTDANGCSASDDVIITAAPLQLTSVSTDVSSCGGSDGSIDLTVSGGVLPYTYSWAGPAPFAGSVSEDISGLGLGYYTVNVTDNSGCNSALTDSIAEPVTFTLSATVVDAATCTSNNGSIDLTVTGGSGVFTFDWNNGAFSTEDLSNLTPGTYTVIVNEPSTSCSATLMLTVNQPTPTTVTAGTDVTVCLGSGTTINATSGASSYNWSPIAGLNDPTTEDPIASPLVTTTYTVTYTDLNSCISTDEVVVTVSDLQLSEGPKTNPTTCAGTDGSISVDVSGGTFPFTYTFNPGAVTQTSPVLGGLNAGVYSVSVVDFTGCVDTLYNITLSDPTSMALSAVVTNTSACTNSNGSIDLTVTSGTSPFTYSWTGPGTFTSNTEDISGLAQGIYSVAVTDDNNCTTTLTDTIENPLPVPAYAGADVTICLGSSFLLNASATGISYEWNPTSNLSCTTCPNPIANPTSTTTYSLTMTDANGCTDTDDVVITVNPFPTANAGSDASMCVGGSVTLNGSGSGVSFLWSPATSLSTTSNGTTTATPAATTTYTLTVTDAIGCTNTDGVVVNVNDLSLSATSIDATTCTSNDGSIDLTIIGGGPAYSYTWTPGNLNAEDISGLAAGAYTVVVSSNGCSDTLIAAINEPASFSSSSNSVDPSLCGGTDGSIDVTVSGGTSPFTFSWNGPNGFTSTSEDITNLQGGIYSVLIEDALGCGTVLIDTLISNPAFTVSAGPDVSICEGSVPLSASLGGVTYSWFPTAGLSCTNCPNPIATPTTSTNYVVTVTDINGCVSTDDITVNVNSLTVDGAVTNITTCGGADGVINLNVSGGTAPYTFSWTSTNTFTSTNEDLTNLVVGVYTVNVTDASGCAGIFSAPVNEPSGLILVVDSLNPTTCSGTDGSITLAIGPAGAYNITWFMPDGSTVNTQDLANLGEGLYNVIVTDPSSGCSSAYTVTLTDPTPLTVYAGIDVNICPGNSISLTASGVTSYVWSPGTNLNTTIGASVIANPSVTTTYTVTGTDSKNCVSTDDVIVTTNALDVQLAVTQPTDCFSTNGAIDVTVTGGTPAYTYSWSNSQTTQDLVNIPANTYTVVVTDATGCADTLTSILTSNTPATAIAPDSSFCEGGGFVLDATGSSAPATYTWHALPSMTLIGTGLTVTITPPNGTSEYLLTVSNGACTNTDTATITSSPLPIVDAGEDQTVIINSSVQIGGNPTGPFGSWFNWTPASSLSDSSLANPIATPHVTTTYSVEVTDLIGCAATDTVVITVLPQITFPNGFTPNGDGFNEVWIIDNIDLFPNCIVEIYNRWGQLLFSSVGYKDKWDGRFKGEPLPVGTYYYIINLKDDRFPEVLTGPITIIR